MWVHEGAERAQNIMTICKTLSPPWILKERSETTQVIYHVPLVKVWKGPQIIYSISSKP